MNPSPAAASRRRRHGPPEAAGVMAIFRTADRLRRYFGAILARQGLTLQQFNVLRILRGAGGELPTMEIRDRMMERAPGITRILDGLVAKGLVERQLPQDDRRRVLCRLTPAGSEVLAALDRPVARADRHAFAALTPPQLATLVRHLRGVEGTLAEK